MVTRKALAEALGISVVMVGKLHRRGMPVDDVAKADKWRRRHLEWTRTKGVRSDTVSKATRPRPVAQATPHHAPAATPDRMPTPTQLEGFDWNGPDLELRLAQHLAVLAETDFAANETALRTFMALIPREDRARLVMPLMVWQQLCPPGFLELIAPGYDASTGTNPRAPGARADRPTQESLHVVFEVQCGLRRFTPPRAGMTP